MNRLGIPLLAVLGLVGIPRPAAAVEDSPEAVAAARVEARRLESELISALDRARRATVSILHKGPTPASNGAARLQGVGSGVLLERDGRLFILTNNHVVQGGRDLQHLDAVTFDGAVRRVSVRSADPTVDLALLQFDGGPPPGLHPIRITGHPSVAEGSWVVATGNPFFLALDGQSAASLGVISGIRPATAGSYIEAPLVQHDAEINPGSSGGPLWSTDGRLLGINGTIATRSRSQGAGPAHTGASFAIPIAVIETFLDRRTGVPTAARPPQRVVQPRGAAPSTAAAGGVLGVRFRAYRDGEGRPMGAQVTEVHPGSPAGGGLRSGDVVIQMRANGRVFPIRSSTEFQAAIQRHPPGTEVAVTFYRGAIGRGGRTLTWTGRLIGR